MEKEFNKFVKNGTLSKSNLQLLKKYANNYNNPDEFLYEIYGKILEGITIQNILKEIKEKKFGFSQEIFSKYREKRNLKDKFISNPVEIKENPNYHCSRCKSNKVVIVEMQTRSADEGFTYFMHCLNSTCRLIKQTDNF